ncbi:deoxycytidyl transferase [Umbelopsis sp. WA50703]
MESVEAGKLLPWQNYRLNSPVEVYQKELSFQSQAASGQLLPQEVNSDENKSLPPADTMEEHGEESVQSNLENISHSPKSKEATEISGSKLNSALLANEWARENSSVNPTFLDKFYTSSRLHYLSMWKAELKSIVGKLRVLYSSQNPKPKIPRSENTRIMHVDFDCFFASVGTRDRPHLQGKPVAVCHSKGATEASSSSVGMEWHDFSISYIQLFTIYLSPIASCNYEARKFGICNGMSVGHARRYCPSLEVIPYEFDKYKEVSEIFYEILYGFADELEPVSVDEALIDVTSSTTAEDNSESELASQIRSSIREKTGCEASIGCGSNILLARLATKKAKPCGQYFIGNGDILDFLEPIPVEHLPGIGYAMEEKLNNLKISTIGDLRGFPMTLLQEKFGKKTGETLYKFARGIDNRPLAVNQPRQSVSAEVSWGVRFENDEQVEDFVLGLCKEVQKRLRQIGCRGKSVTLKVKRRQLDATESSKHLGHGLCDSFSKSAALEFHTDDAQLIFEVALNLLKCYKFNAEDIRGLGVQIQKLDNDIAKNAVEDGQSVLPFAVVKAVEKEGLVDNNTSHTNQTSDIEPPKESNKEGKTASVSASIKPRMEVERQSFIELPLDIQNELHRVYQIVFLDSQNEQDPVTVIENGDDLSYKLNINTLESQQHTDLADSASQEDGNISTIDTSLMELADMNDATGVENEQLKTQLELPPWSQLNPMDLLAMPDNMREQMLKDYSEKGVRDTSNKRKGQSSPGPRSPKKPRNKRATSVRTPTHQTTVRKDGSLSQTSGGKKSFTLTQMFPPQSPSKRKLVHDSNEVHNDWDPNVLSELPAGKSYAEFYIFHLQDRFNVNDKPDIRAELLDEHRRQRERQQKDFQAKLDNAKAEASVTRSNPVTTIPLVKKGLMGVTDISGIRELLRSWVSSFASGPEEEDVATVDTYLMQLAQDRDFHQAQLIVQYLMTLVKTNYCSLQTYSSSTIIDQSWQVEIDKLRKRLDERVYALYQCTLKWN